MDRYNQRYHAKRRVRRCIVACVAVITVMLVSASTANAYPWSSTVTVHGPTQCWGLQTATVTMRLDNGESHITQTPLGGGDNYQITYGKVPSGGIDATAWVRCSAGTTPDYSRRVRVNRPSIGYGYYISLR
jgi:hypothetical protein